MFQTLHFQQRIKRIILIYHAARRCIFLMPQAATNGIEWLHSAFVFIRCTLGCIVYCINSSYSKYSLLKKASETSIINLFPTSRMVSLPEGVNRGGEPRGGERVFHNIQQKMCQKPNLLIMSDCFKKQVSISGHSTVRKWTLLLWEHDGETGQAIIWVGQQGEGAAVFSEDVANEE